MRDYMVCPKIGFACIFLAFLTIGCTTVGAPQNILDGYNGAKSHLTDDVANKSLSYERGYIELSYCRFQDASGMFVSDQKVQEAKDNKIWIYRLFTERESSNPNYNKKSGYATYSYSNGSRFLTHTTYYNGEVVCDGHSDRDCVSVKLTECKIIMQENLTKN
ncbi:MAG: hypothetical protein AB1529_03310 [Candidatus Micrarchaeota archaeon]